MYDAVCTSSIIKGTNYPVSNYDRKSKGNKRIMLILPKLSAIDEYMRLVSKTS